MFRHLTGQGRTTHHNSKHARRSRPARPRFELLDERVLLSGSPATLLPVSVDTTGASMGNAPTSAGQGSLSANGQYEVFATSATNLVSGLSIAAGQDVYRRDLSTGTTALVSVNAAGTGDAGGATFANSPVTTADGRYVAFVSDSTNLTANGTGGQEIYVRDMTLGQTFLVSMGSDGNPGNGTSDTPVIGETTNGDLIIAYRSMATNLTPGDTNASNEQVYFTRFILSTTTGAIQYNSLLTGLASATGLGNGANGDSQNPVLSTDGSRLTFNSNATNLNVGGGYVDSNPTIQNLYEFSIPSLSLNLLSAESVTTTMATGNSPSTTAQDNSNMPSAALESASTSGQYVVFTSDSDNLVTGLTIEGGSNVYRRNLANGTTALVSINAAGTGDVGSGNVAGSPVITPDGRYVAFVSDAANLTSNGAGGLFVRDMTLGQTFLVSLGTDGQPANASVQAPTIAENSAGQLEIAYQSNATNLTSGDSNSSNYQIFVTSLNLDPSTGAIQSGSLATKLATSDGTGNGANGDSLDPLLSKDGSTLAFESKASNLPGQSADTQGQTQIFAYNVASGALTQVSLAPGAGNSASSSSLTISDNGQDVAYQYSFSPAQGNAYGAILAWNAGTGATTTIAEAGIGASPFTIVEYPVISGDGATVAFVGSTSPAFLLNNIYVSSTWQTGGSFTQLTNNPNNSALEGAGEISLSDNGQIIAYGWDQGGSAGDITNLFVSNLATSTQTEVGELGPQNGPLLDGNPPIEVSADGSTVAFNSTSNLLSGVTDYIEGQSNVFAYSVPGNAISLVSAKAPGRFSGDATANGESLSASGRYITFVSAANDLLGNLPQASNTLFGGDLGQGSLTAIESASYGGATQTVISGDGSTVVFQSGDKLTSNDVSGGAQIFSVNWLAQNPSFTLVSADSAGTDAGNGASEFPSVSYNGQVIAFDSQARNLVSNDTANGPTQIIVRNMATGTTTLVTANSAGTDGGNGNSDTAQVSADGNAVVFESAATDLLAGVTVPPASNENVYAYYQAANDTPATFTATAGNSQQANASSAFATALQVTVIDQNGVPLSGASVTFAAPSSGASGTFPGGLTSVTETTNANGIATAPVFTANATAGTFTVTASIAGFSPTASFSLTSTANTVAPQATTSAATGVTTAQATLNGSANPEGAATTVSFVYGTDPTLTSGTTTTTPQPIGNGSTAASVTAALSGLQPGTTYYDELVATSSGGTTDGPILSFTTLSPAPAAPALGAASRTGAGSAQGITKDDGSASAPLVITVGGVVPADGFVQLYNDNNPASPVALGTAVQATGGSATITLNGGALADGTYALAATAAAASGGSPSALSATGTITIQTSLRVTSLTPSANFLTSLPNNQIVVTLNHWLTGLVPDKADGTGFATAPFAVMLIPSGPNGLTTQKATGTFWSAPTGYDLGDLPIPATAVYHQNGNGTATITLTPDQPLATDIYLVSVNNLTDLAGNTTGNVYFSFDYRPSPANSAAPVVTGFSTQNGTVPINNNAIAQPDTIAIAFSKPMDTYTINTSTVQLFEQGAGGALPAVVTYSPSTQSAYLTPAVKLTPGAVYYISVNTGATDDQGFPSAGEPLAHAFVTSFTVGGSPAGNGTSPLTVVKTGPLNGTAWTNALGYATVTFSEPIALSSLGRFSAMLVPQTGSAVRGAGAYADVPVNAAIAFNPGTNQLVIVPTGQLRNDTIYLFELSGISAANGNTLAGTAFSTFLFNTSTPAHAVPHAIANTQTAAMATPTVAEPVVPATPVRHERTRRVVILPARPAQAGTPMPVPGGLRGWRWRRI